MRTRRGHGLWQKPGPGRLAHEQAGGLACTGRWVTATRRIAAPVCAIFCLVCGPARHIDLDGSGMLQAVPRRTAVWAYPHRRERLDLPMSARRTTLRV